jgi:hypothetical protein
MSLINAVQMGDYALVSADTDAVFKNGSRGNVSKLLTIPHCNAVMAVRGSMAFMTTAHAQFATVASDFDTMTDLAELVLLYALKVASEQGSLDRLGEYAKGAEMIIAGYSKKAGKVSIHIFRCKGIGEDIEAHLDVNNAICPGDLGISLEGITASKEGLQKLTERQVKAIRENHPDAAAGGRLLIAEVRAQSVLVETVGELFSSQAAKVSARTQGVL